ncbi:hypothetical protein O7599_33045 [Streptomyces sp. WMMC500]|uniref:hypothetical protein n=1 Tax=Streptomyces sp. WMMC500 TaxID=3015154 RepID=UPI00248B091B|nr:hypothetical protein [Streptomyces sp. WMMC500]WBB60293.1 hypothetical protein O7599_33045 [Streptomyces sp. WMMC500]
MSAALALTRASTVKGFAQTLAGGRLPSAIRDRGSSVRNDSGRTARVSLARFATARDTGPFASVQPFGGFNVFVWV